MDAFAQVASTPLGGSTGPLDMSVYGLFMQADWVVKAVMIALLLAWISIALHITAPPEPVTAYVVQRRDATAGSASSRASRRRRLRP